MKSEPRLCSHGKHSLENLERPQERRIRDGKIFDTVTAEAPQDQMSKLKGTQNKATIVAVSVETPGNGRAEVDRNPGRGTVTEIRHPGQ